MNRTLTVVSLVLTLGMGGLALSSVATASTPDGSTPSTETACDVATGVEFGICNAYCEATDCNDATVAHAADSACGTLELAFDDLAGETLECGKSVPDGTCANKCYTISKRRYMTCFKGKILIPKDHTRLKTDGTRELTETGKKLHGDQLIEECRDEGCYGGHDCASSIESWTKTCLSRCGSGDLITDK